MKVNVDEFIQGRGQKSKGQIEEVVIQQKQEAESQQKGKRKRGGEPGQATEPGEEVKWFLEIREDTG